MKASDLLIHCLENEQTEIVFGIPGEENLDVMDSLLESKIHFIQTRHEQGAAFMADLYGRLTGKAGVCLATLGPGATNLITGVADANMDHSPLVAITGQAGLDRMHKESHQYLDLVSIFKPFTKYNSQVTKPEIIPEVLRKAFKVAQTEKKGACHIDFPEDIADITIDSINCPLKPQQATIPHPPESKIKEAARHINESNFPIILAGNGIARNQAHEALTAFAQKLNIPVANTFMGKGAIPYTHEQSLFTIGLQAKDYISCGFDRADLVISVGYDLVEYAPSFWNPNKDKKIIHIDLNPAEVDASYIVETGLIGDITESLNNLSELCQSKNENKALILRETLLEEYFKYIDDKSFPIKPQKVISDIRKVMGESDIVISDVGAHKMWLSRMYPCFEPNTCIISNGFASMGIALPGAIAAKWKYPEKKVLAVSGDGGFMMNCQELETAVRENIPIVNLIFNDSAYGLIKWKQMNKFKRPAYIDFKNPDFVKFAESFGAKGYRVESSDDLINILNEAFSQNKPAVIDCPVDYNENLKLTEKFGNLICPI